MNKISLLICAALVVMASLEVRGAAPKGRTQPGQGKKLMVQKQVFFREKFILIRTQKQNLNSILILSEFAANADPKSMNDRCQGYITINSIILCLENCRKFELKIILS